MPSATRIIFYLAQIAALSSALPVPQRSREIIVKRAAFTESNGKAAQQGNAASASHHAGDSCSQEGEVLCSSNNEILECANGVFVAEPCGAGLQCYILPLVNKAGTSATCDTEADALARIEATGVEGGITGGGAAGGSGQAPAAKPKKPKTSPAPAPAPASSAGAATAPTPSSPPGGFQKSNGLLAQQLNKSFASISAGSPCTSDQPICTGDGQFAQCVAGTVVATQCAGGTTCMALPLVLKAGTSIACDSPADAAARFAAAGVGPNTT